jgi:hypothetical protein
MSNSPSKSSNASSQAPFLAILLFGGLMIMLLSSLLRWKLADKETNPPVATNITVNELTTQPAANPPVAQPAPAEAVAAGTHRVLCEAGDAGLNFRPQAGFSAPLFVVPCGAIVTVTGAPIDVQSETWSPVSYANRNGWSASKLLQPIR